MNKLEELKARLGEILASMEEFEGKEDFSTEDLENLNAFHAEFEEVKTKIEALEKMEAIKASSSSTTRKTSPSASKIEVGQNRVAQDPKLGFKSMGEFFMSVKGASQGKVDQRLYASGHFERNGEDGGFLIPSDFRNDIQKKVMGDESLLSRTRLFQTSSNHLVMPTTETAPWDSQGVSAFWEAEGNPLRESKAKFGQAEIRLNKLTSLLRVTSELLEDAPALESYLRQEAPEALVHKLNSAILVGDGVGKPQGILNSGFKFRVSKEAGQAADTIVFENVNNMIGRLLPMSRARAVWICNPQVLPQLPLMRFVASATSPVPVYLPANGVAGAPFGTLYGLPILPMMGGVKALGDEGDLMLVDFSYYTTAIKNAGIRSDVSTHVYFNTDEQAYRFIMRVGGQCIYKTPVVTENGNFAMSGFVTLEDRA